MSEHGHERNTPRKPNRTTAIYDPATCEWFDEDTTGHLFACFGDAYVLHVEPHADRHCCYVGSSVFGPDKPIFAWFTAADPRDVLALAVAIDGAARLQDGEILDEGFEAFGQCIHNPFVDPENGQWLFSNGKVLRHPRETYGTVYDAWRNRLVEKWTA